MEKHTGCKYLYKASLPDAVIVKVPVEGTLGMLGKKRDIVVTRESGPGAGEIMLSLPLWAVEKGVGSQIEDELTRWMCGFI